MLAFKVKFKIWVSEKLFWKRLVSARFSHKSSLIHLGTHLVLKGSLCGCPDCQHEATCTRTWQAEQKTTAVLPVAGSVAQG